MRIRNSTAVLLATATLTCFSCGGSRSEGVAGKVSVAVVLEGKNRAYSASIPAGATVAGALQELARADQQFTVQMKGKGDTAFVTAVNGRANEGTGRNWMYAVNGQLAAVGVGARKLSAGDRLTLCFVTYKARKTCGR